MTPLSQAPACREGSTLPKLVGMCLCAPWHVPCLPLLLSGCLYIGPIPGVMYNDPPEILRTEPVANTDEALLIGPSGHSVFVLATDPDEDEVRFTWTLTGEGILAHGYPVNDGEGSQIDLEHDEELDGKTLGCSWTTGRGNRKTW